MPSQAKIAFVQNTFDIDRLFTIHGDVSGVGAGRKHGVEVLNKSAITMITACWEAYIEDVVQEGFVFVLNNCDDHNRIPMKVRVPASDQLRKDDDPTKIWDLAGDGWKQVLTNNKDRCLKKFVTDFHTPKPENVDELFENVFGLRQISSHWRWRGITSQKSRNKMVTYLNMRHGIVHRVHPIRNVTKRMAEDYFVFVKKLVDITDDCLRNHIRTITGSFPWAQE